MILLQCYSKTSSDGVDMFYEEIRMTGLKCMDYEVESVRTRDRSKKT